MRFNYSWKLYLIFKFYSQKLKKYKRNFHQTIKTIFFFRFWKNVLKNKNQNPKHSILSGKWIGYKTQKHVKEKEPARQREERYLQKCQQSQPLNPRKEIRVKGKGRGAGLPQRPNVPHYLSIADRLKLHHTSVSALSSFILL